VIVELKRCPWCNCHELSLEITELQYNISCFQCGCLGPRANTIQQAVRRWNGSVRDTEEGWTSLVVCPDEFGETLQVGITIGHCRRAAELLKTKGVGV
jgi:hypothetical protein